MPAPIIRREIVAALAITLAFLALVVINLRIPDAARFRTDDGFDLIAVTLLPLAHASSLAAAAWREGLEQLLVFCPSPSGIVIRCVTYFFPPLVGYAGIELMLPGSMWSTALRNFVVGVAVSSLMILWLRLRLVVLAPLLLAIFGFFPGFSPCPKLSAYLVHARDQTHELFTGSVLFAGVVLIDTFRLYCWQRNCK